MNNFCGSCGKPLAGNCSCLDRVPSPSHRIPIIDWIARNPLWATILLAAFVMGLFKVLILLDRDSSSQPSTPSEIQQATTPSIPTTPVPHFRLFKLKIDQEVTYVVPVKTTDEQLKSLLWFFRKKVRTKAFKEIGIMRPISKRWEVLGYESGMLVVYRGEGCANEGYLTYEQLVEKGVLLPCGYGEHDAAYYQWGISGDVDKDAGGITTNGNEVDVFDWKDNWRP